MNFVSLRDRSASARLPLAALLLGLALAFTLPRSVFAQSGQWWTTVPGESAATLALALYPRDTRARQAFIDFVLQNNPGVYGPDAGRAASSPLPGNTTLLVPTPGQVVRTSVRLPAADTATRATSAPASAARPALDVASSAAPTTPSAPTDNIGDRLMVQRDDDSPLLLAMADGDDARELVLAEAVDRSINRQLELLERMRELEAMQSNMHAMLSAEVASDALVAQAPTQAPPPAPSAAAESRPAPRPEPTAESGLPSRSDFVESDRSLVWALLAVAGLLGFWLIHRLTAPAATHSTRPSSARPATPRNTDSVMPSVLAHARPTSTEQKPVLRVSEPATNDASTDDALPPPVAVRPAADIPAGDGIEDHESAVELAEIMESFGRVHGAAATLAEFIRSNPHQAITPWLKLMDLHQKSGQRAEFEALARELNRAFNVAIITWDNYQRVHSLSDDTLERYPHIVSELTQHWRTQRGQAYIDHLLRDNRHGTREGFTLPAIEELLVLASLLDEQLGRYVPPATRGGRSQG